MALITKAIRGTQDLLPKESYKWHAAESIMMETAEQHGFHEIRTPVFEHTELFQRSVGETTDVVQKEMYTFEDKGGRSITLRPEGTAGAARAMLEHAVYNEGLPVKAYYRTSCYRYEKPQAGRLREFHQFGVECFGAASPSADAEVLCLAQAILDRLGVQNIELQINSIGCPGCRAEYHKALQAYFDQHRGALCETCLGRLDRNPMRILDCKSPICAKIAEKAPVMLDYLCDDCKDHFEAVKGYLDAAGLRYTINPKIVRGLDYYTKTVFEFISREIGSQAAVCAGGRYDGLIKELGGPDMPSLGFGMGMERVLLLLENQGAQLPEPAACDVYLAGIGAAAERKAFCLAKALRDEGFIAESDVAGRSLKAQMKYADKIGARFSVVLGDAELESGEAKLKNMATGEQTAVRLDELVQRVYDIRISDTLDEIAESGSFGQDFSSLVGGLGQKE